ncbi:hypothetical protein QJS66_16925 [Kocuria rhizophila]|nr:hypothetical protein QJS66_16925 [Kocuria rhizophila]
MANGGTPGKRLFRAASCQFPTALAAFNLLNIRGNFVGSLPELELVKLAQDVELPAAHRGGPLSAEQVNASLDGLRNRTLNGRAVLVAD